MTRRPFLLLLASLLVLLPACSWWVRELEKPEIRVVQVKRVGGGSLLDQRFALRLHLHNPNDQRFAIRQLTFRFVVDDRELMRGRSTDIPVIEPLGDVEFTVHATANVVDTVQLLDHLTRNPNKTMAYTLHTDVELAQGWPARFQFANDGEVNLLDALTRKRSRTARDD